MRNFSVLMVAGALACNGEKASDTADSGTGNCDPGGGAVTITVASVECDGSNQDVTFSAETNGPTSGGQVYIEETNNPPWSEEHDLDVVDSDPCGSFDKLEQVIPSGVYGGDPNDWQRNVQSFFSCTEHYTEPVMNYAFMVFDATGAFADCLATDPGAMGDGLGAEESFNLGDCRTGSVAR